MQVPNGTGQGVRRSKRPLLASRTRCNVLWKPPKFGNKVKIGIKVHFGNKFANRCNVWSIEGVIQHLHYFIIFFIFVQELSFLISGVAMSFINNKLSKGEINYAICFSIMSGNTTHTWSTRHAEYRPSHAIPTNRSSEVSPHWTCFKISYPNQEQHA